MHHNENGFVLLGHCQNILDDPRINEFLLKNSHFEINVFF